MKTWLNIGDTITVLGDTCKVVDIDYRGFGPWYTLENTVTGWKTFIGEDLAKKASVVVRSVDGDSVQSRSVVGPSVVAGSVFPWAVGSVVPKISGY